MDNPPPQGPPVPGNADHTEPNAEQKPVPGKDSAPEPTPGPTPIPGPPAVADGAPTEPVAESAENPVEADNPADTSDAPAEQPTPTAADEPGQPSADAPTEAPEQDAERTQTVAADTTTPANRPQAPVDPDATPPSGIPIQPGQGTAYQGLNPHWDPVTAPFKKIRSNDPLAAAIGNASLLGVGYFLIRRIGWALLSLVGTAALLVLLATTWRTTWFEIVFVVWWVALVLHGWFLAHRRAKVISSGKQRIAAVAFAVPVLLFFGLLRWNGESLGSDLDDARAAGNCAQAQGALDDIWWAHHVADAPMTVEGEHTTDACARLTTAAQELSEGAVSGEPVKLDKGFIVLRGVLSDLPGHEHMVDTVLDKFLGRLPAPDPCQTAAVTDWLRNLQPAHDRLDRAKDVLPKVEPGALLGCGNQLLDAKSWAPARDRYKELQDRFPNDPGVPMAKENDAKAALGIEHDHVQDLLTSGDYCTHPAKYSAAPNYKKGTNRGYFIGSEDYVNDLPGGWKTSDFTKSSIMICLGETKSGPVVRTCPYTYSGGIGTISVAFHKIAIPVKGYALRTGKRVVDTTIQISGSSCPTSFTYTSYAGGPPGDQDITPTKQGVQLAFKFLVVR